MNFPTTISAGWKSSEEPGVTEPEEIDIEAIAEHRNATVTYVTAYGLRSSDCRCRR